MKTFRSESAQHDKILFCFFFSDFFNVDFFFFNICKLKKKKFGIITLTSAAVLWSFRGSKCDIASCPSRHHTSWRPVKMIRFLIYTFGSLFLPEIYHFSCFLSSKIFFWVCFFLLAVWMNDVWWRTTATFTRLRANNLIGSFSHGLRERNFNESDLWFCFRSQTCGNKSDPMWPWWW